VDAESGDPKSLTIESPGLVAFREDVGADQALASLDLRFLDVEGLVPRLEFGRRGVSDPLAVRTTGDIRLNRGGGDLEEHDGGRKTIPKRATMWKREGDLTLHSSGGDIAMGAGERLSVNGALEIRTDAPSGVAQVADLAARDEITVDAHLIQLVRREPGLTRRADGAKVSDGGASIVSNQIELRFDRLEVFGEGRDTVFGVPDPVRPPRLVGPAPDRSYAVAAIKQDRFPLVSDDFQLGPLVLGLTPTGPSAADLSEAFWLPAPRPGRSRPVDPLIASAEPLVEVGVVARPVAPREHRDWLEGAVIYDDGPVARDLPVVVEARLQAGAAEQAVQLYRRLFGPDRANAPRIREILGSALDDYLREAHPRRVLGFELRRYIRNRPSTQFAAYQALEDLDALFREHRRSGLTPGEYRKIQREWLEEIVPEGITLDELAETIHPSRYVRGSDILDVFGQ
jgi:hypothetical protein